MKVLSLKEPFATLIMDKDKMIETRSFKTNYRGELYIHASLGNVDIKERIENELQYPGTIKVTVIRETRAVEEAK